MYVREVILFLRLREVDLAPLAELHQRYQRVGKIMKVHQQSLISP
jgi:hypothetical protein